MQISPISTTPLTAAAAATPTTTVATAAPSAGGARYGGQLFVGFPDDHWTHADDPEGDPLVVPFVLVGPAERRQHASLVDAIASARQLSRGARDAVAVVREPGTGDAGPWRVELMLANDFYRSQRWRGIDLEGVVERSEPGPYDTDVYQTLGAQRAGIVGAVVDGDLVLDRVDRYTSRRPDLPGRNPDAPTG